MVTIKVKRLAHGDGLPLPKYMSQGAAGCDLHAAVQEPVTLVPGGTLLVPTGFCMEIPMSFEAQVRPRSGLALKHGVTVLNSPGTIDSDYRGEVCIILINHSKEPFVIKRGERIAQMVIGKVAQAEFSEVAELEDTHRKDGGFGHTGK